MRLFFSCLVLFLLGAAAPRPGLAGAPMRDGSRPDSAPVVGGGIAAHIAKFNFAEEWDEKIDWDKLDLVTRELAPDHLDWDALCLSATGKHLKDYPEGLSKSDADGLIAALAARVKSIAADKNVALTRNDLAIVACAVVPMQAVKGAGQKYVTTLGDTSRLGLAITKLPSTGVNCGDGCILAQAMLQALGVECRLVGCHRKTNLPEQPVGHAMIEYFETDTHGKRYGHIVDAANLSPILIGGERTFRPPPSRFQLVGDSLGRLQFLISNAFLHEQPSLQGFDPPFTKEELAAPELADLATGLWDERLDARSVALRSTDLEVKVPEGKSVIYKVFLGQDLPEGSTPMARMYRKGADGMFRSIASFALHRRTDSKEVRLVWDSMLDGLSPGDYRVDFYIDEGLFGYRRGGTYAGQQIIHYGTKEAATK